MYWIIFFLVSWLLIFLSVGTKKLLRFLPVGLFSMFLQISTDYIGVILQVYSFHNNIINFLGFSPFLSFGPAFASGILIANFFPGSKWGRFIYLCFFTFLVTLSHLIFIELGYITFQRWNIFALIFLEIVEILAIFGFYLSFFPQNKNNDLLKFR